jgi:AcrR family transcriptional regulator
MEREARMNDEREGQRADARQNRERVLEAARDAFATSSDASLNSIAKAAGVGPGTLYRHFPTREALVLAVYRKEIAALVELAPALIAARPPLDAFRAWCDRLADYGRMKHGLAEALHGAITDRDHEETYWPMVDALDQLLKACAVAGRFRSDVDAEDVLLVFGFLWRIKPGPGSKAQARRLIDLLIDGLRVG